MSSTPSPPYASPAAVRPHRPLWARALALITSPRSVFEEFIDRPSWFWPTMWLSIITIVIGFAMWDSVIAPYSLERAQSGGAPAESIAKMEEVFAKPATRIIGSVAPGAVNFLAIVIEGLCLFALTSFLMVGKATVKQSIAVASHAMLVHIPKAIIVVPLAIQKQDPTVTLGPGALLPVSEATGYGQKVLAMILANLDLFNLWALALCILGMSVVSRLPAKQVAVAIVGAFLAWTVLSPLLFALFQK